MPLVLVNAATGPLPGAASQQQIFTLANPAPGANWTFTIPASQTWLIQAAKITFTASAAAGTRLPLIRYTIAGALIYQSVSPATVTAGLAIGVQFGVGSFPTTTGDASVAGLPSILLGPGVVVASVTENIDAGDQYSGLSFAVTAYT